MVKNGDCGGGGGGRGKTHNFPIKVMFANHNSIDSSGILKC